MSLQPASYVTDKLLAGCGDRNLLLQYLVAIQDEYHCVPPEAITVLSGELFLSETEIHGVIEFYSFLHLQPRGEYDILFSDSITDRMLGSPDLFERLACQLNLQPGTSPQPAHVSLGTTSCTGMCEQGPACLVNGLAIPKLDVAKIDAIAQLVNDQVPISEWPSEFFHVDDNILRRDALLNKLDDCLPDQHSLQKLVSIQPDVVIESLRQSGLRGRGGAGFLTAKKWQCCLEYPADQRYVVCNADEGEPGTFKDRVLLTRYAHQLIEGMTLCAHTIKASKGFIYLRGEYRYLLDHLNAVLDDRRAKGLLGACIAGTENFTFDIDIHLGAGAYVCGEESALIESLEGKRGIPRKRPPFPVHSGYLGKPTVVNNVETFIAAAQIMLHGADWFASVGTKESTGSKLLSISGDCEYPGIYEYPFGSSIRDILQDCGANDVQAVQVSGAAGYTLHPDAFDRYIGFEDVSTGGSFIILGNERHLLDMVKNFMHFFAHESCGFCTPCRVGGVLLRDLVDKVHAGHESQYDLNEMIEIANTMKVSSFCGLGCTTPNVVLDTLKHFPGTYERCIQGHDYEPAFDLDASLQQARQLTGREGHQHD